MQTEQTVSLTHVSSQHYTVPVWLNLKLVPLDSAETWCVRKQSSSPISLVLSSFSDDLFRRDAHCVLHLTHDDVSRSVAQSQ